MDRDAGRRRCAPAATRAIYDARDLVDRGRAERRPRPRDRNEVPGDVTTDVFDWYRPVDDHVTWSFSAPSRAALRAVEPSPRPAWSRRIGSTMRCVVSV